MTLVINLREIEVALAHLMDASEAPEFDDKEALSPDITRRMVSGYAYVNYLLRERINLFSYGSSRHWLELNHLVLCGTTPARREQFRHHIAETEARFYDDSIGGIGERMEYLKRRRADSPEAQAAGIFLHITSSPQLFIEGNSRTATLIASYALAVHGRPPFVAEESISHEFFALTGRCQHTQRDSWSYFLSYYLLSYRVEQFIRATANPRFLTRDGDADAQPLAAAGGGAGTPQISGSVSGSVSLDRS